GLLVPLRAAARIRDPGRLGTAEPADRGPADDLVSPAAHRVARRPLPRRLPRTRQRPVAAPPLLPADLAQPSHRARPARLSYTSGAGPASVSSGVAGPPKQFDRGLREWRGTACASFN